MIALVASTVLPALFVGSATLAATVLVGTWRHYAGAYRRLGSELAVVDMVQTVSVRVTVQDQRPVAGSGTGPALGPVRPARRQLRSAAPARPAMLPARCVAA